jgi:hypothetical protein
MMPDDMPSPGTILCAGTAAAFAAVTPLALFVGLLTTNPLFLLSTYLFGVPLALVPSWTLGLPAYFVLRERWALTWGWAALGGFVVGGLPAALLSLPFAQQPGDPLEVFVWFGLFGAFGGLGFRAYLLFLE